MWMTGNLAKAARFTGALANFRREVCGRVVLTVMYDPLDGPKS
jgi:hypothetical protein